MMYPFLFFDRTYILILIGVVISGIASWNVKRTFETYDRYENQRGLTGTDVAERLLHAAGIYNVRVERVSGDLSDYYDPTNKVLRLSDATANSSSIAALGVAAHECGHAIQDQQNYFFLKFRNSIVPVVNLGTNASWMILILGVIMGHDQTLIDLGIILFSLGFIFQVLTLPVEINASRRAIHILDEEQLLTADELPYAKTVLKAAAMTYVAAVFASLLSLLRVVLLFGGNRHDN
ncbi:MAG: zinc metallopeptidase [Aerococcus sp.]|nr:zinc metallopeptidase [Aerococcus sp.]